MTTIPEWQFLIMGVAGTSIAFSIGYIGIRARSILRERYVRDEKPAPSLTAPEKKKIRERMESEFLSSIGSDIYVRQKELNFIKKQSKLKHFFYRDWWINRRHLDKIFGINMELNNGFHKLFLVKIQGNMFHFKKNTYVIDENLKYYNITNKIWMLDYHENYTMPIRRQIPVKNIRLMYEHPEYKEIELQTNPETLRKFIDSEIAKQVLKAGQLDDLLRLLKNMTIFTLIVVTALTVYMLYVTDAFKNVSGSLGL